MAKKHHNDKGNGKSTDKKRYLATAHNGLGGRVHSHGEEDAESEHGHHGHQAGKPQSDDNGGHRLRTLIPPGKTTPGVARAKEREEQRRLQAKAARLGITVRAVMLLERGVTKGLDQAEMMPLFQRKDPEDALANHLISKGISFAF